MDGNVYGVAGLCEWGTALMFGGSRRRGGKWSPTMIGGLKVRLRADAVTEVSGRVSSWTDLTGNGYHFTQGTAGNRPIVVTNATNGRPAVRFDKTRPDRLASPTLLMNAETWPGLTVVLIMKNTSNGTYGMFFSQGSVFELREGNTGLHEFIAGSDAATGGDHSSPGAATWGVATGRHNPGSSLNFSWNKTQEASIASVITRSDQVATLGDRSGGSFAVDMDVLEVLVFDRAISDGERNQIDDYATERYWPEVPNALPGLALWFRGDKGIVPGTGVATWQDQSGNERHVTQATGSKQPTQATAINSKATLHFVTASEQKLANATALTMTGGHLFAVIKGNGLEGQSRSPWRFGSYGDICWYLFGTDIYEGFGSTTRKSLGNPTQDVDLAHCYEAISTSSEWTGKINGTTLLTTGTNTVGWDPLGFEIGGHATAWWDGDYAEIIVLDHKATINEEAAIVAYLNARYAFTRGVPSSLSGLKLWLEPTTGVTLVGSDVSAWADQSGIGNNATAGVGDRPAFVANYQNGKPALQFTAASSHVLAGTFATAITNCTFIIVAAVASGDNYAVFDATPASALVNTGAAMGRLSSTTGFLGRRLLTDATVATVNTTLKVFTFKVTAGDGVLRINGVQVGADPTDVTLASLVNYRIGMLFENYYPLTGHVSEVVVYDSAKSDEDCATVEGYMIAKYGIT